MNDIVYRIISKKDVARLDKDIVSIHFTDKKILQVITLESGQRKIEIPIDRKKIILRKLHTLLRKIINTAKSQKIKKIVIDVELLKLKQLGIGEAALIEMMVVNFGVANWSFVQYKEKPKQGWGFVEQIYIVASSKASNTKSLNTGKAIATGINECRALANTPGGDMTPAMLATAAKKAVAGSNVKVKVLGEKEIKKLKMGALLGVARGSKSEPRFIIMEYKGGTGKPIVLVGKGVTFDTGGLNLKPTGYFNDMQMDMSGGAAVIHTIAIAEKLGIKKNIIGLIPAAENMVSGESYRPGDILKSMSGKTIEVMNTDAEGRLILADALTYAAKYKPKVIIDVATLTGASMAALGQRASALFTRDKIWEKRCIDAGEEGGEYVWPLPLWEEYDDEMKGVFADLSNISKNQYGGAITGAIFLKHFVGNLPWIHLDIAPRMVSIEGDYMAKGATGVPIRLLIQLLRKLK